MKTNVKTMCQLAMGIALYVVLSMTVKIPLISHMQTDLGYIVFGTYLILFGWQATLVGVIGCTIESMLFNGFFPIEWIVGQAVIGIICGLWFKYTQNKSEKFRLTTNVMITIIAVFIGIGLVKTVVACSLYGMPFSVKFAKDMVAFVADVIPMIVGVALGQMLQKQYMKTVNYA